MARLLPEGLVLLLLLCGGPVQRDGAGQAVGNGGVLGEVIFADILLFPSAWVVRNQHILRCGQRDFQSVRTELEAQVGRYRMNFIE